MKISLTDFQSKCETRFLAEIKKLKSTPTPASSLHHALLYSLESDGKRIRPLLVYLVGSLFNAPLENLDAPALAIEIIHTYSLIHDDLPAMDNSPLRRGKPACHIAFGEAIAILTGDALQPLAFEILTKHPCTLTNSQRLKMIQLLASASGLQGMVAGQVLDIKGVNTVEQLQIMYSLKTGQLLRASVLLGATAANIEEDEILNALTTYINKIGLAYQIQDDLLDVQGDIQLTGKPQGLDSCHHKITYPTLIGIEASRSLINTLFQEAIACLDTIHKDTSLLRDVALLLIKRDY